MQSFRTRSVAAVKPPKPVKVGGERMPSVKLPTMKTGGGPKLPTPSLPKAASSGRGPSIRSTPYSSRIALAASPGSPGALGTPPAGYRKQRNQPL